MYRWAPNHTPHDGDLDREAVTIRRSDMTPDRMWSNVNALRSVLATLQARRRDALVAEAMRGHKARTQVRNVVLWVGTATVACALSTVPAVPAQLSVILLAVLPFALYQVVRTVSLLTDGLSKGMSMQNLARVMDISHQPLWTDVCVQDPRHWTAPYLDDVTRLQTRFRAAPDKAYVQIVGTVAPGDPAYPNDRSEWTDPEIRTPSGYRVPAPSAGDLPPRPRTRVSTALTVRCAITALLAHQVAGLIIDHATWNSEYLDQQRVRFNPLEEAAQISKELHRTVLLVNQVGPRPVRAEAAGVWDRRMLCLSEVYEIQLLRYQALLSYLTGMDDLAALMESTEFLADPRHLEWEITHLRSRAAGGQLAAEYTLELQAHLDAVTDLLRSLVRAISGPDSGTPKC